MPFKNYIAAAPSSDGRSIFVITRQQKLRVLRYDAETRRFSAYLHGLSAHELDFSRNGKWVTYSREDGVVCKLNLAGGEEVPLTPKGMQANEPHWSPDGLQIAFMGQLPGQLQRIYVIGADADAGRTLRPLSPDGPAQGVPTWSGEGDTIVFGDVKETLRSPRCLHFIDLATGHISDVPGSEGMWTPRWSPDGRHIAALSVENNELKVLDVSTKQWTTLVSGEFNDHLQWTGDSRFIHFRRVPLPESGFTRKQALFRVRVGLRKTVIQETADLRIDQGDQGGWSGVAPDGSPLIARFSMLDDIYAIPIRQ